MPVDPRRAGSDTLCRGGTGGGCALHGWSLPLLYRRATRCMTTEATARRVSGAQASCTNGQTIKWIPHAETAQGASTVAQHSRPPAFKKRSGSW